MFFLPTAILFIFCVWCFFSCVFLLVIPSASDCLERLVSKMTYYLSSMTWNSTHSLTLNMELRSSSSCILRYIRCSFKCKKWQALQSLYNSQIYEKDAEKRCVLRFYLSTCKVLDDVTSDDGLLHVFAVATGKTRSPIIRRRVDGTASDEVEDERYHIVMFILWAGWLL